MKIPNPADRRKSLRMPIIDHITKDAKMYLSPPLIMDPVHVVIQELSSGGMKIFTTAPIPTRFLFAIVFSTPFAQKIYAEAKILHVNKCPKGYTIGAAFVNIKPDMRESLETLARDFTECEKNRKQFNSHYCEKACSYNPICSKEGKIHVRQKPASKKKSAGAGRRKKR